ncbi:hypothetical protein NIES23_00430 [Trichormus variabilis NIES-23]|uniref:Uncharacterized protein n=1 Tax=Trichormus variabilis NIES-23 TaxID=1973479 RepID=A0A1Z4KE45_ANAVA|nr:hypothetical protein NIES23_00430 [Trichormus variabilis NIES-23]
METSGSSHHLVNLDIDMKFFLKILTRFLLAKDRALVFPRSTTLLIQLLIE